MVRAGWVCYAILLLGDMDAAEEEDDVVFLYG